MPDEVVPMSNGAATVAVIPAAVELPLAAPGTARGAGRRSVRYRLLVAGGVLLLAAAAALSADIADSDSGSDSASLAGRIGADCSHLRWQFTLIVIVIGALHYVASGLASRAAAGLQVTVREVSVVQLAAAAANRLTPAGLGGSAVNIRYFTQRGLSLRSALGAIAVLTVVGAVADIAAFAVLVLAGPLLGLGGGGSEVRVLWRKISALLAPLSSGWLWLLAALVVVGLALFRSRLATVARHLREVLIPIAAIARAPRRLSVLAAASGSTTLLLALAFVASVAMVPGSQPSIGAGALLVGFMAASAAGNAVPIPAGLGSTELALVAVLVAAAVPTSRAVEIVVIFRLITFWLPAVAGVVATRYLQRVAAL
jgi:uncharacterized membrane protein YbhN (UPF0104 family)